jgi:outer membrane protein TolC
LKFKILNIILFLLPQIVVAQVANDVWSLQDVLRLVRDNHPIVQQSNLGIEIADAERLAAQGNFDPYLNYEAGAKTLGNEKYYNYQSPEVSVPLRFGADVIVGTEYLGGDKTDPTNTKGYSSFAGINIPLAKGLLFDKRRAAVAKAKIYQTLSQVDQRMLVNDILIESIAAYWNWVRTYQRYLVISKNVDVTSQRFELVKKAYNFGERAAIDTTELLAQLQSFQLMQQAEALEVQQAKILLSTYLWQNNTTAIDLAENSRPSESWESEISEVRNAKALEEWLLQAGNAHPSLSLYDNKLQILQVEKRLAQQNLLPKVDFRYNQLGKDWNLLRTSVTGPLFNNNFQYGLKVGMPLLLREARGNYKATQLSIKQTEIARLQKLNTIQNKVRNYYVEYINLQQQITLQEQAYKNYQRLVSGEEQKLFNGESSIFLINARENKALEALEKLIDLKTKFAKSYYSVMWAAGQLTL